MSDFQWAGASDISRFTSASSRNSISSSRRVVGRRMPLTRFSGTCLSCTAVATAAERSECTLRMVSAESSDFAVRVLVQAVERSRGAAPKEGDPGAVRCGAGSKPFSGGR